MKNTKIVATIGPASEKIETLQNMMKLGLNVCRLNFSHGEHSWHEKAIEKIKKAARKSEKRIGIMADIQGPRIRVASKEKIDLDKEDKVFLSDRKSVHSHRYKKEILLDWDDFYVHVKKGDRVFIEDGLIDLEIEKREKGGCVARVLVGGTVQNHKGVNIPAISSHLGFLTEKDLKDLDFVLSKEVDFIAASFVGSAQDIVNLRNIIENWEEKHHKLAKATAGNIHQNGMNLDMPWIVAKIERKRAIKNIDKIIEEADAIMVARGDLAIEMQQEKVTIFQKEIIKKCNLAKKPVIVATQMMHSMIEKARPTRAEITDITNAVIDQADAVMLSNETAIGNYPELVIETVAKIIKEAEDSPYNDVALKKKNKFARLVSRKKRKKDVRKKLVLAENLRECLEYSSLRQEDVKIKLDSSRGEDKRKGTLIWGAR
jgi:pyruvate kinase